MCLVFTIMFLVTTIHKLQVLIYVQFVLKLFLITQKHSLFVFNGHISSFSLYLSYFKFMSQYMIDNNFHYIVVMQKLTEKVTK